MNIILFGFKGCGKTYLGKLLSLRLKKLFIDTDQRIEQCYARQYEQLLSIREIYQRLGEKAFRTLETQEIFQLQSDSDAVIAVGGGSLIDPRNLTHLKKVGQLVYLKTNFDVVKERILQGEIPSFVDAKNPIISLHQIYQERVALFESIEAFSMDSSQLNTEEMIRQLSAMIFTKDACHGL